MTNTLAYFLLPQSIRNRSKLQRLSLLVIPSLIFVSKVRAYQSGAP